MFFPFGIVASFLIFGSNGQETCLTASGVQDHECISILRCSSLLELLKQTEMEGNGGKETLTKSICGFEESTPKVCCPRNEASSSVIPDPPDVTNHSNLGLINHEMCGPLLESRIIQGNRTKVFQFPWMALIAYNISGISSPQFACGGTVITKRYVLTAAHCVTELPSGSKLSGVRLGEHDLSKELDCDGEDGVGIICAEKYQDFEIESFHVHSEYSKKKHENDIALVRMNRDANFEVFNVKPICLPVGNFATLKSKKVIVTGWGTTEIGIRSQVLLRVKLEVAASSEECAKVYLDNHGVNVTYKQLCAGGKDRRDSCTGDSGGPLQYPNLVNGTPKWIQYGIINFGSNNCGTIGYPGVYLKVAYYMDWILDNITE